MNIKGDYSHSVSFTNFLFFFISYLWLTHCAIPNCIIYDGTSKCSKCDVNYYLACDDFECTYYFECIASEYVSVSRSYMAIYDSAGSRSFYVSLSDTTGLGVARKCPTKCYTCSSASFCTKCPSNQYLYCSTGGGCTNYDECISSIYLSSQDFYPRSFYTTTVDTSGSGIVQKCPTKCYTCSSANLCTKCKSNQFLYCSTGDGCTDYDYCIPSAELAFYNSNYGGSFYVTSYKVDGSGIAQKCASNCYSCSSKTKCTECLTNYYLYCNTNDACTDYNECIPSSYVSTYNAHMGTYDSVNSRSFYTVSEDTTGSGIAKKCTSKCYICMSALLCYRCHSGQYLYCSESQFCSNYDECIPSTSVGPYDSAKSRSFYPSHVDTTGSGVVYLCPSKCYTCSSEDFCTKCFSDQYLYCSTSDGCTDYDECVSSTYLSSYDATKSRSFYTSSADTTGSGIARKCPTKCYTCSSAILCTKCPSNKYLYCSGSDGCTNYDECISSTDLGTYDSTNSRSLYASSSDTTGSGIARQCPTKCYTCSSASLCTKCPSNKYLYCSTSDGCTDYDECISSTYLSTYDAANSRSFYTSNVETSGAGIALKCPSKCYTCSSATLCTKCHPNSNKLLFCSGTDGCTDYDECISSDYLDTVDNSGRAFYTTDNQATIASGEAIAHLCSLPCRTCTSPTVCTSCPNLRPIF